MPNTLLKREGEMPWNFDDNGNFVKDESGNPVWIDETDKTEKAVNPEAYFKKISELNKESMNHRLKAKEVQEAFEQFKTQYKDLDDPEQALKALETVKNLKDGDFLKADQVDALKEKIRREFAESYESKIKETSETYKSQVEKYKKKSDTLEYEIEQGMKERAIANSLQSGVLKSKTTLGNLRAGMGYFGDRFKRDPETGKMVGYHWNSDRKIISTNTENAGEPADMETCLKVLYETDTFKDGISKEIPGGAGSTGGHGTPTKEGAVSTEEWISGLGFDGS